MKIIAMVFLIVVLAFNLSVLAQESEVHWTESELWGDGKRPDVQRTTRAITKWFAEGKSVEEISELLQSGVQNSGTGLISGTVVQSDGQSPLPVTTYINVYDQYGFYIGSAYVYPGMTAYSVLNLPTGSYYVQAIPDGNYLDEFYDGTADWRQATLVTVEDDSTVSGINFQLDMGKVISGKVLEDISLDPLAGRWIAFSLYDEDAVLDIDNYRYYGYTIEDDGTYYLSAIRPGNYKLNVFITEYAKEFYNDKINLSTADVIQVSAETDTVEFINFVLSRVVGIQDGYEPNAVYEEAFEMMVGQNVMPKINPAGDFDYFTFEGNQGDSVDIELNAQSIGSRLFPYLILYDSTGTRSISAWSSTDLNITNFVLPYTGRYYLRVTHSGILEGGEDFFYDLSVKYSSLVPPTSGYISGNVYLKNDMTPYNGSGYWLTLYDDEGYYQTQAFFYSSNYIFSEIPAGTYKLAISPSDQGYLFEWYEDVRTFEEATTFNVSDMDTTSDINFILDPGGGLSGRLFLDNLLSDYTEGGYLYLYNPGSGYNVNSFYIPPDAEGLFTVSGIIPGDYALLFSPYYSASNDYPPVWYENVGTLGQATSVAVSADDTTNNITFVLKRGGQIQGFIYLPGEDMVPASMDSLQVSIIPYDPLGYVVNYQSYNTFAGGYRTGLLYPGMYKLQALAEGSTLSSWYYDTGSQFDDPGSQTIEVMSDSVHEVPIVLNVADGSISGIVYKQDGVTPTDRQGWVYAYDATGHMVQSTIIGVDPETDQLLDTGHYRITGLKSGTYYLMLAFGSFIRNGRDRVNNSEPETPSIEVSRKSNIELNGGFTEIWYPDVVVEDEGIMQLYFQQIPEEAMSVDVTEPGETEGINFNDLTNSLADDENSLLPQRFELSSIYPNPFNPSTTITFNVPYRDRVKIEIFDILGRSVATLLDEIQSPGSYRVEWNGKNRFEQAVSSGIYIARLQAAGTLSSKKMVMLK